MLMQASVTDTPCLSGWPGTMSCRSSCRWLQIMTPVMRRSPASICWATSAPKVLWRCLLLVDVGVRHVDHHLLAQAGAHEQRAGGVHLRLGIAGLLAAAQDGSSASFEQRQRVCWHGQPVLDQRRRDQRAHRTDADVVCTGGVLG
jgi:hypothetical protein